MALDLPDRERIALKSALGSVDKIMHEPGRLMIVGLLSMVEEADFNFLLLQTGMTKGNLSTHLRKLEGAGYVEVTKEFLDRVPHTVLRLKPAGAKALQAYRNTMAGVLGTLAPRGEAAGAQ